MFLLRPELTMHILFCSFHSVLFPFFGKILDKWEVSFFPAEVSQFFYTFLAKIKSERSKNDHNVIVTMCCVEYLCILIAIVDIPVAFGSVTGIYPVIWERTLQHTQETNEIDGTVKEQKISRLIRNWDSINQ